VKGTIQIRDVVFFYFIIFPHVREAFLNDVFIFLTEVGNAGRIVNMFGQLGIRNRALNT
jgi:hypothetical protein